MLGVSLDGAVSKRSLTAAAVRKVVDVEALLVWVYATQQAHMIVDRAVGLFDLEAEVIYGERRVRSSADGIAAIERLGLLGVRIDESGAAPLDVHPDAEKLHRYVSTMGQAGVLLKTCARRRSRPDWDGEALVLEPRWKDRPQRDAKGMPIPGTFVYFYELDAAGQPIDPTRSEEPRRHKNPRGCVLQTRGDGAERIAAKRAEYRLWHSGLVALATYAAGRPDWLKSHSVTGPLAKAAPWGRD
jgi:hypothetical protein